MPFFVATMTSGEKLYYNVARDRDARRLAERSGETVATVEPYEPPRVIYECSCWECHHWWETDRPECLCPKCGSSAVEACG